jgi:hypothetical protein
MNNPNHTKVKIGVTFATPIFQQLSNITAQTTYNQYFNNTHRQLLRSAERIPPESDHHIDQKYISHLPYRYVGTFVELICTVFPASGHGPQVNGSQYGMPIAP